MDGVQCEKETGATLSPTHPPKCVNSAPPPVRVIVDLTMEASSSANTSNAKTVLDHTSGVTPALPTPSPNIPVVQVKVLTKAEKEKMKLEAKAKKEEERLKREQERLKREQEKQLREQEKREKQKKRESEMKERREKKEREELEKKERKEKREAERQKKEEEKKRKQEEKRKLEEEKEMLQEEKLRKENQRRQKFRGFFQKIEKPVKKAEGGEETILTAFSVKDDMALAKAPRLPLEDKSGFDQLLEHQSYSSDYIQACKSKSKIFSTRCKKKPGSNDDDVTIVSSDDSPKHQWMRFKLLQFCENHRPAYYGTWRKSRGSVNPRNPFKKDEGLLDYEVDSDNEWEEEEPGESISNSEGEEKDGEGDGDESEDEDDGFFVPHGYLSNDEGEHSDMDQDEDREAPLNINSDARDIENKKCKQLAKAWEAEFARKCQPLHPKVIGCVWPEGNEGSSKEESFLSQFAAISLVPLPIAHPVTAASKGESTADGNSETRQPVPEEAMSDLIRFIHKNPMGMNKIIKTFRTHWGAIKMEDTPVKDTLLPDIPNQELERIVSTPKTTKTPLQFQEYENSCGISKRQLEKKVQVIAVKEYRAPINRPAWYVHQEILRQYGLDQENFTPLRPDGSPPQSAKLVMPFNNRQMSPPVDPPVKQIKRNASKSLLQFLKSSPVSAKRIKLSSNTCDDTSDVMIVEPSPLVATEPPPPKKACPSPSSAENPIDLVAFTPKDPES